MLYIRRKLDNADDIGGSFLNLLKYKYDSTHTNQQLYDLRYEDSYQLFYLACCLIVLPISKLELIGLSPLVYKKTGLYFSMVYH